MLTSNDSENKLSKVQWRCKRGMLELDLMLQNFCEVAYVSMTPEKQQVFEQLLEEEDQTLQRWLVGTEPTGIAKFQDMVLVIRHMHAMSKNKA